MFVKNLIKSSGKTIKVVSPPAVQGNLWPMSDCKKVKPQKPAKDSTYSGEFSFFVGAYGQVQHPGLESELQFHRQTESHSYLLPLPPGSMDVQLSLSLCKYLQESRLPPFL